MMRKSNTCNNSVRIHMQYESNELINRLRQFFIFEVCRDETIQDNGEFRCDTFSPRNGTETYIIYDDRDSTILGYVLLTKNTVCVGNGWHINEIMILPKYRGKGYGKDTIERIIDIHKRERIEACPADNESKDFWDKMVDKFTGYKENGFVILNNR